MLRRGNSEAAKPNKRQPRVFTRQTTLGMTYMRNPGPDAPSALEWPPYLCPSQSGGSLLPVQFGLFPSSVPKPPASSISDFPPTQPEFATGRHHWHVGAAWVLPQPSMQADLETEWFDSGWHSIQVHRFLLST